MKCCVAFFLYFVCYEMKYTSNLGKVLSNNLLILSCNPVFYKIFLFRKEVFIKNGLFTVLHRKCMKGGAYG